MSVEVIKSPEGGRTHRCLECGWHGIPTIIDGEPVLQCPHCPPPFDGERIARNAPCPCGSGTKFKKCCGR